jgi:phospholipid transport system substrate-binding protein
MNLKMFAVRAFIFATILTLSPPFISDVSAQMTASAAKSPETTIKTLADKAFAVLRDKSLKAADRDQKFRTLLREGFALDVIGNTVLGRNRTTATPAQLQAFNTAFPDYVVRIYASRLTEYAETNLAVKGTTPVGTRGDVNVNTMVSGKNVSQPVSAVWRLRNVPGQGLKIIDLSIEGVSMVATQRDEFNARIQARGMDMLNTEIRGTPAGKK